MLSEHGSSAIVAALHCRDPFSVFSTVYSDFSAVISARRADNESFKAFESRFDAAVSRFRSHGSEIAAPEPIVVLMLLKAARVADNQRVSMLVGSITTMPIE